MALSAGHPDWNIPAGDKHVALRIDGGPAHPFEASPVGNFFLVLVTDGALARKIGLAHRLTWTLPSGSLSANVAGLGVAFDAVRACTHRAPPTGGA